MLRPTAFVVSLLVFTSMAYSQSEQPPSGEPAATKSKETTESYYRETEPLMLLGLRVVRDELAISDDQIKEIDEVRSACLKATNAALHEFQNLKAVSEKDWDNQLKAIRRRESAATKAAIDRVNKILSGTQLNRLNELVLQHEGAMAFDRPDIATTLMLTAQQRKKIAEIRADARRKGAKWTSRSTGAIDPERRAFFAKINASAKERAIDILNAEQKAAWARMTGPDFRFSTD
jgi:hypothetical protein